MSVRFALFAALAFASPIATASQALAEGEGNNLAAVEVPASTGIYYRGAALPAAAGQAAEGSVYLSQGPSMVRPVVASAPQQLAVRR